jgi:3-hydroxy-9,10-secoandrosta-1,3,5(10)-triene-9,17-dione monooxygenase
MASITSSSSKEAWLEKARALVPVIRDRADETEELRRIPEATVNALRDTGLFRILQPRRVNGAELEFGSLLEITSILANGCASTAWVFANIASHSWMLGMWPARAQNDVWGSGNFDALIAASLAFPPGRAVETKDGFVLRGNWTFCSGVDACDWVMLGATVEGVEDGTPMSTSPGEFRTFLVPRSDCTVLDNWFVAGLKGTGSKDISVDKVFVPAHRTLALSEARGGDTPGSELNPGPLYRIPLYPTFGYVVAGVPLGIAQAAVDRFVGEDRHRRSAYTGRVLTSFAPVQMKFAEAAVETNSARRILLDNCARITELALEKDPPTLLEKARLRSEVAYAARLTRNAVDRLFEGGGSSALYLSNPLQRTFQDMHAATAHVALNWDAAASVFGRVAVGQEAELPPHER